jgi:hypothetical protein
MRAYVTLLGTCHTVTWTWTVTCHDEQVTVAFELEEQTRPSLPPRCPFHELMGEEMKK